MDNKLKDIKVFKIGDTVTIFPEVKEDYNKKLILDSDRLKSFIVIQTYSNNTYMIAMEKSKYVVTKEQIALAK